MGTSAEDFEVHVFFVVSGDFRLALVRKLKNCNDKVRIIMLIYGRDVEADSPDPPLSWPEWAWAHEISDQEEGP